MTACPICSAIPDEAKQNGAKCTLHGGVMTATEVEMRWSYGIFDGAWVKITRVTTDTSIDHAIKRITSDGRSEVLIEESANAPVIEIGRVE